MRHLTVRLAGVVIVSSLSFGAARAAPDPDLGAILHTQRLLQAGERGQGVRIGVISNGASNYAALSSQGVLPSNVAFFGGTADRGDEGDWMLQVVHQIAPQAQLAFCPGGRPSQTVDCARALVTAFHADIVVDDINPLPVFFFPTEKATGMAELARQHPNVLFFTGAGNNGGGYYEGAWTPVPVEIGGASYAAQDFGRSVGGGSDPYDTLLLPANTDALVMLGTNSNPNGSPRCANGNPDVTLALLDENGALLDSTSGRCPVLQLRYQNSSMTLQRLRIAILQSPGSYSPHLAFKLIAIRSGEGVSALPLQYRTTGSAGNSATTPGLIAVAAVDPNTGWRDHYLDEAFANSGPQCLEYSSASDGRWTRLDKSECIRQPAFVVPDRASVIGADGQVMPFIGDSSAGPAAAGVAALLLSAHVAPTRIVENMERTATPQTEKAGWDPHYGYGLLNADAAAVASGVLSPEGNTRSGAVFHPPLFRPTPRFLRDQQLSQAAQRGDMQALADLRRQAEAGDADAQTGLAMYAHGSGDDASALKWARAASEQGQPVAQGFLGTLFNRGWGTPMDPRAAQAWWLRAARAGVVSAMYNIGTTVTQGRGAMPDPMLGYVLMRAAEERGMRFSPMDGALNAARSRLNADQTRMAEAMASHFAADPASVPEP